jgi:nifR3 family TIM-barrel protein
MFYIGPYLIRNPYLLAPMAGVSEMPFRVLSLKMGAGLATTELVSANGIFYQNERTKQYLTYDKEVEKPYSVQLFGGDEVAMAKAAEKAVQLGAHIVDINMGCPVKKVTKTGAGSALLCDAVRAQNLVKAMRSATGNATPITVKIRLGWDEDSINCVDMAKSLEQAGAAAIALHARTRAQGYSGQARWSYIADIKKAVQIPIIGNGDVSCAASARAMSEETNCDGVMIGRAALGNPWIFSHLAHGLPAKPTAKERLAVVKSHWEAHLDFHRKFTNSGAWDSDIRALRSFRNHMVWYSRGLKDAALFRECVMKTERIDDLVKNIEHFFGRETSVESFADLGEDGIDYRQAFG